MKALCQMESYAVHVPSWNAARKSLASAAGAMRHQDHEKNDIQGHRLGGLVSARSKTMIPYEWEQGARFMRAALFIYTYRRNVALSLISSARYRRVIY